MDRILLVVICLPLLSGTGIISDLDEQSIKFLKGVHRLNEENSTDYYISCCVIGEFAQWQYSDEPLTVLEADQVGSVVVDVRATFEYTATLLSSQLPTETSSFSKLESILVVSFSGWHPQSFNITCISNSFYNTTTVSGLSNVKESSSGDPKIKLEYVLSMPIGRSQWNTSVFICGAKNQHHFLVIDGYQFLFDEYDNIGDSHRVLTRDGRSVSLQSVLVARRPFNTTTSIIFIPGNSNVSVACFFETHRVQLPSFATTTQGSFTMSSQSTTPLSSSSQPSSHTRLTGDEASFTEKSTQGIISGGVVLSIGGVAALVIVVIIFSSFGSLALLCWRVSAKGTCHMHNSNVAIYVSQVCSEKSNTINKITDINMLGQDNRPKTEMESSQEEPGDSKDLTTVKVLAEKSVQEESIEPRIMDKKEDAVSDLKEMAPKKTAQVREELESLTVVINDGLISCVNEFVEPEETNYMYDDTLTFFKSVYSAEPGSSFAVFGEAQQESGEAINSKNNIPLITWNGNTHSLLHHRGYSSSCSVKSSSSRPCDGWVSEGSPEELGALVADGLVKNVYVCRTIHGDNILEEHHPHGNTKRTTAETIDDFNIATEEIPADELSDELLVEVSVHLQWCLPFIKRCACKILEATLNGISFVFPMSSTSTW